MPTSRRSALRALTDYFRLSVCNYGWQICIAIGAPFIDIGLDSARTVAADFQPRFLCARLPLDPRCRLVASRAVAKRGDWGSRGQGEVDGAVMQWARWEVDGLARPLAPFSRTNEKAAEQQQQQQQDDDEEEK